jgi:hypothetical protein
MGTVWMAELRRRQEARRTWSNPALDHEGMAWQAHQRFAERLTAMSWDLFSTHTLAHGQRESAAYLLRRFGRWRGQVQARCGGREPLIVLALEKQKRGTEHGHALIATGGLMRAREERQQLEELWLELAGGWGSVREYDVTKHAAEYCTKYVTKDGHLEFFGAWRAWDGSRVRPPQRELPEIAPLRPDVEHDAAWIRASAEAWELAELIAAERRRR